MKDWDAIRRAYTMADAYFVQLRDEAAADPARSEDVAGREELVLLNGFAYFLLMWGQFETFVDEEAGLLGASPELAFMQRFAMLDPGRRSFDLVERHYFLRCDLAHGRTREVSSLMLPPIADALESIVESIESGGLDGGAPI